jgi:hypothetical protein
LVVELEEEAKTTTTTTPLLQRQTNPVPYTFTYLRSRDAQRQYPKKLKLLFDYLGFCHPPAVMVMTYLEQQGKVFLEKLERTSIEHKRIS